MFVLLTFSCLLVSRKCMLFPHHPCLKCMLFPHHPCLSCSLFLAFSSLDRAWFSSIAHLHSFAPPIPIQIVRPFIPSITTHITFSACSLTDRFGIRAFFKHGTTVNCSLFHGQG
ncbi:hypothetical protein B0H14DRAFT_2874542 [Mycena olivaceomarginata]|nr:hypothetical protein B0H14DRAFT_2874542 [Mycena olivaceomarginata]